MKFLISRISKHNCYGIKDFKTIEDLIEFKETVKHEIIITNNYFYKQEEKYNISKVKGLSDTNEIYKVPYKIEIYDDYRE